MTSSTFKAKLEELGIIPSHSRPRVSNDNAFAEVYTKAREANPTRWSRGIRNWEPVSAVALNPERLSEVSIDEKKAA